MPCLNKFRRPPELKISLTCSYESIQFSRDNIDIDIRHGLSQWPTLVVKTIKMNVCSLYVIDLFSES